MKKPSVRRCRLHRAVAAFWVALSASCWVSGEALAVRPYQPIVTSCDAASPLQVVGQEGGSLRVPSAATDTPAHVIRLAGIDVPASPRWSRSSVLASRQALKKLIGQQPVMVQPLNPPQDRYGRCLADVLNHRGQWLQYALVRAGHAYVNPLHLTEENAQQLLQGEALARRERSGLWREQHPPMLQTPQTAVNYINTFQIVEGVVARAKIYGRSAYLDFGDSYRNDFTILIPGDVVKALEKDGVEMKNLVGRKVQARGVLRLQKGPTLIAYRPALVRLEPPQDMPVVNKY
jgi:micrococcal nuclease